MESLYAFCKRLNLPRSSVHAFLTDQGYSTNEGVSEEMADAVLEKWGLDRPVAISDRQSVLGLPEFLQPVQPAEVTLTQFDQEAYAARLQQEHLQQQVASSQIQAALSAYAQSRLAQAFAAIDVTVATAMSGAMQSPLGKQPEGGNHAQR